MMLLPILSLLTIILFRVSTGDEIQCTKDCDYAECQAAVQKSSAKYDDQMESNAKHAWLEPLFKEWNQLVQQRLDADMICTGEAETILDVDYHKALGYMAVFASDFGQHYCDFCEDLVSKGTIRLSLQLESLIKLYGSQYKIDIDEDKLMELIPSPKYICQRLIPGCRSNAAVSNSTTAKPQTATSSELMQNATKCFECLFCKSSLTYVQFWFITNPELIGGLKKMVDPNANPLGCQNLVVTLQNAAALLLGIPIPDNILKMIYDMCVKDGVFIIENVFSLLHTMLAPDAVCYGDLHVCLVPHENPNLISCAKELCEGLLQGHKLLQKLCNLIPG